MSGRVEPTGECWCGCSASVSSTAFFVPGHDRVAEAAVVNIEYGGVPEMLVSRGYGPGGKNPRRELEAWRARGGKVR